MSEVINIVTLSLEEYTKLIIENHDLKGVVAGYKRKVEVDVDEELHLSYIDSIKTKAECWKWLSSSDEELLKKFSDNYSWRWESISERNYGICSTTQVKNTAVRLIKKRLNERMADVAGEEEDSKEE